MSIRKKLLVTGAAVLMLSATAMAELKVTPYGAAQYRLRAQHNMLENSFPLDSSDTFNSFDYSNRLCWRTGIKVSHDDVLSLQFQIGNDWGAAENVNWNANHSPFGRAGTANLYAHIASAKWNPGVMFIEAGIVPINNNGTLSLLSSSLGFGNYASAGFNGWADINQSLIGMKVGAPILKGDVKVGAELFQSVIDNRQQSLDATTAAAPKANPASVLMVLAVPISVGDIKITPEFTGVINRNYNAGTEKGDHEIIGGLAGSYKVNDNVSLNLSGGYGMVNNEKSKAGAYGTGTKDVFNGNAAWRANTTAEAAAGITPYISRGMLIEAGATIRKVGPGDIQVAANFNNSVNAYSTTTENTTDLTQIYSDIRYIVKLHDKYSFTPRYRTYTTLFAEDHKSNWRFDNRFELIFEGAF